MHFYTMKRRSGEVFLVLALMCSLLVFSFAEAQEETGSGGGMGLSSSPSLGAEGRPMEETITITDESWAHLQTYLGALITHAAEISVKSPHATEDIRAIATDLAGKVQAARSPADRKKVVEEFRKAYREIFPEKDLHSLTLFQEKASALLAEIPDVLPLLVEGATRSSSVFAALRSEAANLQMKLSSLADSDLVASWFDHFETFGNTLLSLAPPAPLPLVKEDLRHLLTNLSSYLQSVENMKVATGVTREDIAKLQKSLESITEEKALDRFLGELENVLTHLRPAS